MGFDDDHRTILTIPTFIHSKNQHAFARVALDCVIGEGTFAKVRHASLVQTKNGRGGDTDSDSEIENIECAVKCIDKSVKVEGDLNDNMDNEIAILARCIYLPYVAKMFYSYDTPKIRYIVMEYCTNGDLHSLMELKPLPRDRALRFLAQIAVALSQLHTLQIVYHDLKPRNICIDKNDQIKLVDFGMARVLDERNYNEHTCRREFCFGGGTLFYSSPEIFLKLPHSFEADWWSFGVVGFEMLAHGKMPFEYPGSIPDQCAFICSDAPFHRNEFVKKGSIEENFFSMFLEKNQHKRFGFGSVDLMQIMLHEIFRELDWSAFFPLPNIVS